MTISILKSLSAQTVRDMNVLMRELSSASFCDEQKLKAALEDEGTRVFVAREDDGLIIGTATLCISHTPEFVLGGVEAVVVLPECRGRHIAGRLMEALLNEAREAGVQKLHLTSRPERVAANLLYQKLGFVQRQTNFYEKIL